MIFQESEAILMKIFIFLPIGLYISWCVDGTHHTTLKVYRVKLHFN